MTARLTTAGRARPASAACLAACCAAVALALAVMPGQVQATGAWTTQLADAPYPTRHLGCSVSLSDDTILTMGGQETIAGSTLLNDVWKSTDKGSTWSEQTVTGGTWGSRWGMSCVALSDDSVLVLAGRGTTYFNDVWKTTAAQQGTQWTEISPAGSANPWEGRRTASVVVLTTGEILLMGGMTESGASDITTWKASPEAWRSADNGVTWTQLATPSWGQREGASAVAMPDGSVVLLGGRQANRWSNDAWRSIDKGDTWTQTNAATPPGNRYYYAAAVVNGAIVMVAGNHGGGGFWRRDVLSTTDFGATFTTGTDMEYLYGHSMVALSGGDLVVTGGTGILNNAIAASDAVYFLQGCHSTCSACSGTTATDCTACSGSRYLSSGSCLEWTAACTGATYESVTPSGTQDRACAACNSACTSCTGATASTCSACASGYSLTSTTCSDVNECGLGTDNCDQVCTNTVGSFTCSCASGFTLNGDGHTCDDDDECATNNGGCAQTCTNTAGSFACSCTSGFHGSACTAWTVCSASEYEVSAPSETVDRVCGTCNSVCATCAAGSDADCTAPAVNHYTDVSTGVTQQCDASCAGCTAAGDAACVACADGYTSRVGRCRNAPDRTTATVFSIVVLAVAGVAVLGFAGVKTAACFGCK